jgi:hypothetical protein
MKKITLLLICLIGNFVFSHTINYENVVLRHWSIEKKHQFIDGSFMMYKNGIVFIEDANNAISKVAFSDLSNEDQKFVTSKNSWVKRLNTIAPEKKQSTQRIFDFKFWLILLSLIAFGYYIFTISDRKKLKFLYPVLFLGIVFSLYSFTKKALLTTTDPLFVKSAFLPFASTVSTSWDNTYFYVNSKGIPNHTMMVGISSTGWQQQVPIPQCYVSTYINQSGLQNAWSIPLNPVIAATPVPVNSSHFTIGAIAIAANGVAIFNLTTTSGANSYTTGQLDYYGGHCGKGDDYHYHTAPLHLISSGQTTANVPLAFALDGFAIYGSIEPDGSALATLDANHGHYSNGVYHYHGTSNANGSNPQMITNMVGQVTEDSSLQIVPQALAKSVRGGNLTQLGGALITSCVPNGTNNGYNLSYSLNGVSGYATNYSWNGTVYTYNYVTPTGTTVATFNNGFSQCTVPNLGFDEIAFLDNAFTIYPNPTSDFLNIKLRKDINENDIQGISIYDLKGSLVSKTSNFKSNIDIKNLSKGSYVVKIEFLNYLVSKKIIVK